LEAMPAGEMDRGREKGRDKETIKENLLRQGVPADEIQKVYRTLRGKGYGEEEARQRSSEALERMRQLRALQERRRAAQGGQRRPADTVRSASDLAEAGRRAVDKRPVVRP